MQGKWKDLSDAQRQQTAVGVAGIYQLSRFNALMLNSQTAVDATTTSINSQGSAFREQEKYSTSLEARINRLQNAWTGLAATAGDSIIYDSIVVLTSGLKGLTNAGESTIGFFGALAPVFGTVATAAVFFSSTLRGLVVAKYTAVTAAVAQTGATGLLGTTMGVATVAAGAFATALRTLLTVALPIGIAVGVLGFAIEKLTGFISANIQEQEKFDQYINKNSEAITTNKDTVDELITEYNKLTEAKKNPATWDSTKEEEYLGVQQRLGEFFPAIIESIDSTGQSHLKSADAIQKEIDVLEELVNLEKQKTLANANDEFEKLTDTLNGGRFDSFGNIIEGSLETQIARTRKIIKQLEENGSGEGANKLLVDYKYALVQLEKEFQETSELIKQEIFDVAQATNDLKVSDSVAKNVNSFISSLDTSTIDSSQLKTFGEELGKIQDKFQEAVNKEDTKLYEGAQKSLNALAKEYKLLDGDLNNFQVSAEDFFKAIGKGNVVFVEGEQVVDEYGNSIDSLNGVVSQYKTSAEALAMVSQESVDSTTDLLYRYQGLSEQLGNLTSEQLVNLNSKQNLTAQEQELLITLNQLNSLYPTLLDAEGKLTESTYTKIKAIEQENKSNKILLEVYEESTYAKLTADQKAVLSSASRTKGVINNIKAEIQALNILQQALQATYNEQAKLASQSALEEVRQKYGEDSSEYRNFGRGAYETGRQLGQTQSKISDYSSQLDTLRDSLTGSTDKVSGFIAANEESEKASKKSNKETEKSTYVTDKYKQAIEALTLAIEKQQKLRSQYPTYSQEYQKSLQNEIKLQKEKLALEQQQAKSTANQIKSGNIQQTGVVKQSSSSGSFKPSGFQGTITSSYGNRTFNGKTEFHRGTDIANPLGSRQDSFASGKVIASGSASSQGYDKSYGNLVVVQSDDGTKRLYAHLQETLVKVGDIISAGTQIGKVGSTGNSTGSHLHYELYKNGKLVDSSDEVAQARKGITGTSGGSNVINGQQQSIDQAKSDLISIETSALATQEAISQLELDLVNSYLSAFEYRRKKAEDVYNFEEAKLKNIDKYSDRYTKTIEIQAQQLAYKQSANNDELAYLDKLLKSNTLNALNQAEMKSRYNEVKTAIQEVNNEIGKIDLKKFEVNNVIIDRQNNLLEYNAKVLETLSKGTERYQNVLEQNVEYLSTKQKVNQQELDSLQKMAVSGKYSGEVLEEITQRIQELTISVKDLAIEIQENNFEVIVNIKTKYDEAQDDIQFELDRSEIFKGTYTEGSALFNAEIEKQIELYKKLAQTQDESRRKLQEELKSRNLTAERIKEITELLEDETLAYLNSITAIDALNKELKESQEALKKDIADGIIAAIKAYYQERKDEHLKAIDAELKRETEAHEKRKKQLTDELDLFRKNVEERIRLIDRQEAERGYNQEIDELEKERNKTQQEIDLLSLDDTNEAKSKRKKLQEQLDKIDKDIAEKRHDRDIELQKQGLSDLLESKEQEIDGKIELEDEQFQAVVDRINREKEYWEKHYNDLMNDERKFAKIREDIAKGNFANIQAEFGIFIQNLIDTLPALEDTLDGTMEAAGTSIRLNVIDQLKEAIKLIDDFNALQSSTSGGSTGSGLGSSNGGVSGDNFDPNSGKGDSVNGSVGNNNSQKTLTDADFKVLFAKYMREQLVTYEPLEKNKQFIRDRADQLASEGRKQGSSIPSTVGLDSSLVGYDKNSYQKFSRYILANTKTFVQQPNLQQQVKLFGNRIASLDTGGMLSTRGGGVDGKGGKYFVGHDGEVVNNPLETSQLLKTVDLSNSLFDKLRSVISPILTSIPNFSGAGTQSIAGDTFEINLNGNFGNTSQSEARRMGEMIGNAILTKKGGNW